MDLTTTVGSPPLAEIAATSDPGRDPQKQVNEDAYGESVTAFGHLAFVCDGMGGHANGRDASQMATKTILEWFAAAPLGGSPRDVLRGAIEEANRKVYRLATPSGSDLGKSGHAGSTCVAILVHDGGTEVAHVGDSRAMLLHQGQVFPITRDHSRVQQMVDAELITPEEAAHHPDANQITRALGIAAEVEVELRPQPVAHIATDVFVLSSDGLTDLVKPDEILHIVGAAIARGGSAALQLASQELVALANSRGGHDNITVVLARPLAAASTSRVPVGATVTEQMPATRTVPAPPHTNVHATQVGVPLGLGLQQGLGMAPIPIQHTPPQGRISIGTPPPTSRRRGAGPSGFLIAIAVGGLSLVMIAGGVVLYMHFADRAGRSHGPLDAAALAEAGLFVPVTPTLTPSASGAAPSRGPVELVPTSVSSASASPPVDPLAPLAPFDPNIAPTPSPAQAPNGTARPHPSHPK